MSLLSYTGGPPGAGAAALSLERATGMAPSLPWGQPSPSGSGTRSLREASRSLSCTTQSWTWNCSHAAASRFRKGTGEKAPSRASSRSLTTRGLGSSSVPASVSAPASQSGWLRPKGVPAAPVGGVAPRWGAGS